MLVGHCERRIPGVRLAAGQHFEQHDANRIHVSPGVGRAGGHLLGREIGGSADDHARLRLAGHRRCPGQPEVCDLHDIGPGQQNVLWLHIAVHDARFVRHSQAGQYAVDNVEGLARAQLVPLVQQLAQGLAPHVLHGQVMQPAVRALVVNGDDVRTGQPRGGPGLADEPADKFLVDRQLGMGDLERYRAVQPRVGGKIDRRHAAARKLRFHPVAAIQQLPGRRRKGRIHREQCRARGAVRAPLIALRKHM